MKQCIIGIFCGLTLISNLALAQGPPHPDQFQIIYGNRDGTADTVMPGALIRVPIWVRTDPDDYIDSVATMFNPLKSLNTIIAQRDYGDCGHFFVYCPDDNRHYHCGFMDCLPNDNDHTSTAQLFRSWERIYPCFLCTEGDTVRAGAFKMRVTEDTTLAGQTYCPFAEGSDSAYGSLLWKFSDTLIQVVPVATYGCLYIKNVSYISGDANGDWIFNAIDIVYMINYLKGTGNPPPYHWDCANGRLYATADANGNCVFNGLDITYSVNYLLGRGPAPRKCPDC